MTLEIIEKVQKIEKILMDHMKYCYIDLNFAIKLDGYFTIKGILSIAYIAQKISDIRFSKHDIDYKIKLFDDLIDDVKKLIKPRGE